MNYRAVLCCAGVSGVLGVGLGAFGAHGLREMLLTQGTANAWDTAVRYHLLHALGLFCAALWLRQRATNSSRFVRWTAHCWILGTLLFSGSLYGLALGGPRWLGPVTPIGGLALMVGWILLVIAASAEKD